MADVTISQLTRGIPSGSNLLPYSTGSSTLGVPASAILQSAGYVGIGTTNPLRLLHVEGGSTPGAQQVPLHVGCGESSIGFGVLECPVIFGWNGTLNNAHKPLSIRSTSSIQLYLNTDGNVGIGTSTPSAKLEVNGDIKSTTTAKAYAIFDGSNAINTDCTVLKSYNISRIQKMSDIGAYKVTFTNSIAWPYVPMVTGFNNGTGDGGWVSVGHGNGSYYYAKDPTSTELYLLGYTYLGSWQSQKYVSFLVF